MTVSRRPTGSVRTDRGASPAPRAYGLVAKLSLALASTLVAILLIEGALQLAALALHASGRDLQSDWLTRDLRVLALGDSNTFGLYLEAHESYPSQLQSRWNERIDSPKIEVINLGYPSTNSSRLLVNFDRMLNAFDPNVVLVQIGVNDYWTAPVELNLEPAESRGLWSGIRRRSRLYKLLHILRRSTYDPEELDVGYNREAFRDREQDVNHTGRVHYGDEAFELSEAFEPGSKKSTLPMPEGNKNRRLAANLEQLVSLARQREVELLFLTYPSEASFYGHANQVIRRTAAASRVVLADPGSTLAKTCPEKECPQHFLRDHHATASGNAVVADDALDALSKRLQREP